MSKRGSYLNWMFDSKIKIPRTNQYNRAKFQILMQPNHQMKFKHRMKRIRRRLQMQLRIIFKMQSKLLQIQLKSRFQMQNYQQHQFNSIKRMTVQAS